MATKKISGKVIQFNDNQGSRTIGIETKPAVEAKEGKKGEPAKRVVISSTNHDDLPAVTYGDTVTIQVS